MRYTTHQLKATTSRSPRIVWLAALLALGVAHTANAGAVRVWATGVVVSEDIHLRDVCEMRGFDRALEQTLRDTRLMKSPAPGQSITISQRAIRDAIRRSGANMATVTVSGSSRCEVNRPDRLTQEQIRPAPVGKLNKNAQDAKTTTAAGTPTRTLRSAVIDFFNSELTRYRGRADVTFDRASQQMLELTTPPYTFHVRRRGPSPLGLVGVEVDVISSGAVVQTVPLVAQVAMSRDVVVARRSINQDATVGAADVETTELRFSRVEELGLLDASQIIGQRAKRFISSGSMIELSDVESVPIVVRGQLITLVSVVGGIEVMTTGKAADDGLFGDVIKVRAADNRRIEFDAVVIGPGRARVGGAAPTTRETNNIVRNGS